MRSITVPVLIVGGGGSGLSASNFLADLEVESLLIERHPATSHLPKAHYINQRTMEIYRQHGMADAVYAESAPRENLGKIVWRTPLGGDSPLDQKILKEIDALGGGGLTETYDLHGTTHPTHISQLYLEPILRRIAVSRNPGRVLFRHELISFTQDKNGVQAVVRDLEKGEDIQVCAQYLLGADAGKTVGPAIGVKMIAPMRLVSRVAVHFSADLSRHIHHDNSVMIGIVNPNGAKAGHQLWTYLIAMGPTKWGRHSAEWTISLAYGPDETVDLSEEHLSSRIQAFLQVDVPITIHRSSQWFQESMVADRFGQERILLVGDAAHKHPPATGLGLNSGIQDAHNICWKLALVVQGKASPNLLNSYQPERQPVVARNCDHSMLTMMNISILVSSFGLVEGAPPEYNQAQIAALLSDTPDGAERRWRMDHIFQIALSETACQGLDIGFVYGSGALISDGTPPGLRDPAEMRYYPSTRPGSRLPHVWLRQNGKTVSTHDLIPMGGFLLLTGKGGDEWRVAAEHVAAESGITLRAVLVDDEMDSLADPAHAWSNLRGVAPDGAILVRPDGHVAFRAASKGADSTKVLRSALRRILGYEEIV